MGKKVYIEFRAEIRDEEYSYGSVAAVETLGVTLPSLEFFSQLDIGNLFKVLSLNLEAKFKQALLENEKEKQ